MPVIDALQRELDGGSGDRIIRLGRWRTRHPQTGPHFPLSYPANFILLARRSSRYIFITVKFASLAYFYESNLVFGLATLIFNGLEIAMHATLEGKCVAEIVFAHPILQALFTFLQMHFLFVNSEVLVEKFGLLARFGFMHLIATNVSLWIRTVVWESANEWLHYLHHQHLHSGLAHSAGSYSAIVASQQVGRPAVYQPSADYAYFDDDEFDSANTLDYASASVGGVRCNQTVELISQSHIRSMVGLYQCFNNNTLGKIWTSSMPHLFPFLVEYK